MPVATSSITKLQVKPQGTTVSGRRSIRSTALGRRKQYIVQSKPRWKITKWQLFNIIRRLVVIVAAFLYIYVSMMATWRTMEVLRDMSNPTQPFGSFTSSLIGGYIGDGFVRDSPLVQDVLGGDTTPRDYVLFLESETKTSVNNCSNVPLFTPDLYKYAFLIHGYMEIVNDTSYNVTILDELELVVVVVDCSFTPLTKGDRSAARVFSLVRSINDPDDLYLVMASLSVQDYEIRAHNKFGPALLGMLTLIHDMGEANPEQVYLVTPTYPYQRSLEFEPYEFVRETKGYLELRSVPRDPLTQPVKDLLTTRKRGFFDGDVQSNINYMYTLQNAVDAKSALTDWEWFGQPTTTDAWAWIIHIYRFNLLRAASGVLDGVVSYSNKLFLLGDEWVPDVVYAMSPMDFWSAFQIPAKDGTFIATSFFPRLVLLLTISHYAMLRKVYRHFYPEKVDLKSGHTADRSTNEKAALAEKGHLTNFEISTGAELQTRFGIISDYKNYVYFKGMKFASADGVYCSGYVIVNGKFLVASKDLQAIVMMKLVRARYRNVYAYEIEGNNVQDAARLVFPDTFTWTDLWHLKVSVLL
ncbi:hypothetical protein PHYSODRAFT_332109 [Phytophthora sojae]|uniref:Uncharacterized protein n=1 Tax=Phytophthora sojae (strain P6497) TaxID=1094619 RepID=G4ZJR4_PHYSP|nr:hypothetical protein PHYSODRAFT_332109 [Phytophthora sojae]EGZ18284.1 hypothetical protein PHYSODRAFT_332109 [Phytophthora sojae]|eukprot:XP_009527342.1 hypothetical protein PHYSODRAFT_332109 [Phytophthora sojae]